MMLGEGLQVFFKQSAASKQQTCTQWPAQQAFRCGFRAKNEQPESKTEQKMARVKERGGVEISSRSITRVAKNENPVPRSFNRSACYVGYVPSRCLYFGEKREDQMILLRAVLMGKGRRAIYFIPSTTPFVPQSNTNLLSPQKQKKQRLDTILRKQDFISRLTVNGREDASVGEESVMTASVSLNAVSFFIIRL